MAKHKFTLTSYDPVYVVAEEVMIPENVIREQAVNWLNYNVAKDGEEAKLTDSWVDSHCEDFKNVEELLIFIRYNMYRENVEVQRLSDQNVVCAELATRLVEELPVDLLDEALYASNYRLEDMIYRQGMDVETYCEKRGISEEQLREEVKERTIQSLKEDSALAAYAEHEGLKVEAEDFYEVIPGDSIEEKAHKRRQIELDGRLEEMEEYALKTKALNEVMANAMIKRTPYDAEWIRYGDTSKSVIDGINEHPDMYTAF